MFREDALPVLRVTAARDRVQRHDRPAYPGHHLPPRLLDGAIGQRVLGVGAGVNLAARRRAQVVPLVEELSLVSPGVGPGGDGLRLERLDLRPHLGAQLRGHDAAQVRLQIDPVDRQHGAERTYAQLENSAVGGTVNLQPAAR